MPANTLVQFSLTLSLPTNPRLGCAGCSLRYSAAKQPTNASRSCAFSAASNRCITGPLIGCRRAELPVEVVCRSDVGEHVVERHDLAAADHEPLEAVLIERGARS